MGLYIILPKLGPVMDVTLIASGLKTAILAAKGYTLGLGPSDLARASLGGLQSEQTISFYADAMNQLTDHHQRKGVVSASPLTI